MVSSPLQFGPAEMEAQRRALGMSRTALARRSGVSLSTVKRILTEREPKASFDTVTQVARSLGMDVCVTPTASRDEMLLRQARTKARQIVGLVQGSMALEGQAVQQSAIDEMIDQTARELLAGSRRRLWG